MGSLREPTGTELPDTEASRVIRFKTGRAVTFRRGPKYKNKKAQADGLTFDSKKEMDRYLQLKLLERAGHIRNLILQPTYRCVVAGILICKYRADFGYDEVSRETITQVVEDVKGFKTPTYQLKKKLMRACHGIEIRET